MINGGRAETIHVIAGRKKFRRINRAIDRAHHVGEPIIPNAYVSLKRRPYDNDGRE